jgi:hypothetical protein
MRLYKLRVVLFRDFPGSRYTGATISQDWTVTSRPRFWWTTKTSGTGIERIEQ